jgi:NAD(P)-dependent dehydrogenase (short-subunit alcohol dehydrogenase family)
MKKKLYDSGFKDWNPAKLKDLSGKRYFITGGNSGIGLEAAKILSSKGADVIIASRDVEKARNAVEEIKKQAMGEVDFVILNLASTDSVKKCAQEVLSRYESLDGLINNAGIMQTPKTKTVDGFELQFATNHLGHFLLNSLLFELVEKAAGRIVVVSSLVHKVGKINFEDLMSEKSYDSTRAYSQSKLANLMYALELDRRLKTSGSSVAVVACHPGYSGTNLQSTGPVGALKFIYRFTNKFISQPAMNGAYPTVLAAAGEEAIAGAYYGPQNMAECRGRVSDAVVAKQARDIGVAAQLWETSEELLGLSWPVVD